jgi:rare lipoprotein A
MRYRPGTRRAQQPPAKTARDKNTPPAPNETNSDTEGLACFFVRRADTISTGATADRLTAAHRTFPFGSRVRVTNVANRRSVVVTVTDRGPNAEGRIISVSREAAEQLGFLNAGTARVRLELQVERAAEW